MPYNFRKRVQQVKKKTWYGRRYMAKGGVGRLVRDVRWLKGQLNTELKVHDVINGTTLATEASPVPFLLNGVPQGVALFQHTGGSIKMKSLQVNGKITQIGGSTTGTRYRVVYVLDKEPLIPGLGNPPTWLDIFNTSSVNSFRNWNSILQRRFKIIKDTTYQVHLDYPEKQFKDYLKMNTITKFQGSTTGHIQDMALYMYVISDGASGATNFEFQSRMTFIDN